MKKRVTILSITLVLVTFCHAGMGQILASWPAPGAYLRINGIAFQGEYIWLKSNFCEGRGVYKCVTNGSVVSNIGFPYHGYNESSGLAFDGQYLWTIYHQPQGPVPYDHYVKYTTTGSEVYHFRVHPAIVYDSSISVSWDGGYLWTEERSKNQPVQAGEYTTAGTLISSYDIPQKWGTGAGYYNRQIWAGGPNNYVYGMSILGASVVGSFPAPGGSCRAVGFDGEYLWTADANTPQYIYKVDIDVVDVAPGSFGKIKGIYR